MRIHFKLPYFTHWGQRIYVTGNSEELGNNDFRKAFPLNFQGHEDWVGDLEIKPAKDQIISYKYILFNEGNGQFSEEWGERSIEINDLNAEHYFCFDVWNDAGSIENVFMTSPFQDVLLKDKFPVKAVKSSRKYSHVFSVKAPLLREGEVLCLIGNCEELSNWAVNDPVLMTKADNGWSLRIDLSKVTSEIHYKYGVYNQNDKQFLYFEQGPDRYAAAIGPKIIVQVNDGFVRMDNQSWKCAGVGLPVFSIRTRQSFGAGDFVDLKLLVDWSEKVGLKLIQLLPLNDTNGTHTNSDVLPYAAITAFGLNPLYLNLPAMGKLPDNNQIQTQYIPKQAELNAQPMVPFLDVINFKMEYARQMYLHQKAEFLNDPDYLKFFEKNALQTRKFSV